MIQQFVQRVVGFCIRNRVAVMLVTAAVTALMAWAVRGLQVDSDVTNLLPRNVKTLELTKRYGRSQDSGELLLAVEAEDPFTIEGLRLLEQAVRRIQEHPEVTGAIHPFNMVVFESQDGKLRLVPAGPGGGAPRTPDGAGPFPRPAGRQPPGPQPDPLQGRPGPVRGVPGEAGPRVQRACWPRSRRRSGRCRPATRCT